jgi:alkaline phosphatase D
MNLQQLRLGYISCQDYTNGYYTALVALLDERLDYVIHLGDYIYETRGEAGSVRVIPPFPSGNPTATTLADYRHLYRTYRADAPLQRIHENFAFIQIWDDHEFANDSFQDYHPDNNPNPSVPTPQVRQAANQAWSEYVAAKTPFDPQQDPLHSIQIYRSFQFGTLADLVMTDERLYRDAPPCGLGILQRYFTTGCENMNNPTRTMLGYTQRAWFLDRMQSSTAKWKIWGNELMNRMSITSSRLQATFILSLPDI